MLPVAERLRRLAEKAFKDEEHMRTHPDDADEGTVVEVILQSISRYGFYGFLASVLVSYFDYIRFSKHLSR